MTGDPRNAGLTALARRLGWPGGPGTPFDVLPLVVQGADGKPDERPRWFTLPQDAVLEVELAHPEYTWWRSLGLRWHAVPALANMCLEIGGICYPAAPFNGWYMGTEIGARNLADTDRYNLLPYLADRLGLDTRTDRSLWKDRALVELNRSVLHSFDHAGVTVTDHHTESRRFLTHLGREERKGRRVGADWSWIVPPISGSATPSSTAPTRPWNGIRPTSTTRRRAHGRSGRRADPWSRPLVADCYRRPRRARDREGNGSGRRRHAGTAGVHRLVHGGGRPGVLTAAVDRGSGALTLLSAVDGVPDPRTSPCRPPTTCSTRSARRPTARWPRTAWTATNRSPPGRWSPSEAAAPRTSACSRDTS